MLLLMSLVLVSSAVAAQYTITLTYPDKSIQVCSSPGFAIAYLELDINVTQCRLDKIFADSMGG
jgi:hypothetical protein